MPRNVPDEATVTISGAQWLAAAVDMLTDLPSPEVDAELLLAHLTSQPRHRLRGLDLDALTVDALNRLVARRRSGEPVQYLTGEAPFRHLVLHIGPGALIPRPETELLVDHALAEIAVGARRIVDLGSGAGPLAIAIATESPVPVEVFAVEREPEALAWLERNIRDFAPSVRSLHSDVRDLPEGEPSADLVVANPPYLPDDTALPVDVADYEPAAALWGGGDEGLELPRLFAAAAWRILRPGGLLLMEHSDRHQDAIVAMLSSWSEVVPHRDLTGRPRFVSARRPVDS